MAKPIKSTDKEVDRLLAKYPNPRDVRYAPTLERTSSPLRDASPELYGFLGGAMGTAPDEFEGSVLDPLSARVKSGAAYGFPIGTALNVAPLIPAALKGTVGALTRVANAGSGPLAGSLAAQRGVIKAPGGNWLSGSVEDALKGLKGRYATLEERNGDRLGAFPPLTQEEYAADLALIKAQNPSATALDSFVDKQLTRYVKNDMATERDPIRALAERGVLHVDPETLPAFSATKTGVARSPLAEGWESVSDRQLDAPWEAGALVQRGGEVINKANPWAANIPPETLIHRVNKQDRFAGNVGFDHLMDELRNATNPNSGLPAHLLLDPKSLDRVSVPQAVERVAAINEWRAAQKAEANAALANNAATVLHKEYADAAANPKGLRWVELKHSGEDAPFQDAVRYEGDTMGHSVGGYASEGGYGQGGLQAARDGRVRLYSLRDAKGQPHVTVEVKPGKTPSMTGGFEELPEEAFQAARAAMPRGDFAHGPLVRKWIAENWKGEIKPSPDSIIQIKGKGNRKPNDEYLPFVQDFVKSGQWSDVGDFHNTGLLKLSDYEGRMHPELMKRAREQFGNYATQAEMEALHAPKPDTPMPGYATGGTVAAPAPQSWQALYRKNNATEQPVSDQNKITQTKDQFLAKYADALDANGRFVPGKANLWFDGENASDVYDKLIGKQTVQTHYGNPSGGIFKEESFFNPEVNMDWIEDPRAGGGWAGMKGAVLPGLAATGVILSAGALAGAGAGSAAGGSGLVGAGDLALAPMPQVTAASLGSNASGLAGALGMKAGVGATALNSGALNAGVTALRGGNIGQVLKSGVQGAVLSPIASYGSEMVGGGTLGSILGNSLQGGAANILGGRDAFSGFRDGAVNGLVRMAGDWAGAEAKDFTGSDFAGKAANSLTQTALKGKDISSTLDQLATQYASGQLTDLSGMDPKMAAIVVNLARNKKGAATNIAAGALTQAAQRAVGSAKLSARAVGA